MKLNQRTWKLIDKIDERQPNRKDRRFLAAVQRKLEEQEAKA